jgi:urease accessory protein
MHYTSQGSTKVFRTRPGQRHARPPVGTVDEFSSQRMEVNIGSGSSLFLLPDPVTCFRSARYNQLQTFRVAAEGSVVLLDWINSGRKSLGEDWSFSRYYSLNELWVDGERIARDAMLLEETQPSHTHGQLHMPIRTLAERLAPYSCYATVLLYGPLTTSTMRSLQANYSAITVFRHATRPNMIWSVSPICGGRGCVLRVAALETEEVRHWLGSALSHLKDVIGDDIYSKTFG